MKKKSGKVCGLYTELDAQLELALMMGYINMALHAELTAKLTDISKMLFGLTKSPK